MSQPASSSLSSATFSARAFAVYLFIVGALLILAPNFLLSLFGIAPTTEVWVRVVGVLAFMLGVYAWVGAAHRPFLEASVYTRTAVFVLFTTFVILKLASPMLALFGVVDLLGGLWTFLALKRDLQPASSHRAVAIDIREQDRALAKD